MNRDKKPEGIDKRLLDELAGLQEDAQRESFLDRHPELVRPEVVVQIGEAVPTVLRLDSTRALGLAEGALAIGHRLQDPETRARGMRAKANVLYARGQNRSAMELHEQSLTLFNESGNKLEVGRTLSASIQPLLLLGEYDRAFESADKARAIFTELQDVRRLARLEINVGNILHRQDRFDEALACYEKAYEQLLPLQEVEGIAVVLHNITVCSISLNNFSKAEETYRRAREFCERHQLPLLVHQADYNIAYLYFYRGEYSRAIEILRATRQACTKIDDPYHAALSNLDLSEIYLELNLSEEAAEIAREACVQFKQLGMAYETAKAVAYQAIALGQQGKAFRALEFFGESRKIFAKEKNRAWPSLIDLYQALVLANEGRFFEAQRLARVALEFFQSSNLPSRAALCHLLLGRVALHHGECETARRECASATEKLENVEAPALSYQIYLLLGQVSEMEGKRAQALEDYQKAREALETLRAGVHGDELKISFMKNKLEVFESLIDLCLRREEGAPLTEEAFALMERAKSRSLADLVFRSTQAPPPSEPVQSGLVRRIRDLREELNWYYHRIEREQLQPEERSEERLRLLQSRAVATEKELMRFWRELPSVEKESDGLREPMPFSVDQIRSALPAEATLIEYFRVRDRIVAALVTRESVEIVPTTLVSRTHNLVRMLQFQLSKFRLGPDYVRTFQDTLLRAAQGHLQDLYQELLEPLIDRLEKPHVIFAPHDMLHYVPFHALFDGERYVIERFTVSYAPSATVYALCQERKSNPEGPSLILGVPDAQAPFILDEVQSVASTLPAPALFLGAKATSEILREKGPSSRFIHIATHGIFRHDNPTFSGIRLGDAYLSLYDFCRLRLPVELMTLSGCVTGLSAVAAGDELIGLMRGLLYSGSQTLLLTLWEVHDRSTSEFMKSFYRHLLGGSDKRKALKTAMIELKTSLPHPYYWAPFVLMGRVFPRK